MLKSLIRRISDTIELFWLDVRLFQVDLSIFRSRMKIAYIKYQLDRLESKVV